MGSDVFWTNVSLNVQVDQFEKLLPSLCTCAQDCKEYLSKALFVVGEFGSNDYSYPLIAGNRTYAEVTSYVPHVVQTISIAAERLIHSGAVNLVVPGHPASSCFALTLTVLASFNPADYESYTGSLKPLNDVGKYNNVLFHQAVTTLQTNILMYKLCGLTCTDPSTNLCFILTNMDYQIEDISFTLHPLQFLSLKKDGEISKKSLCAKARFERR